MAKAVQVTGQRTTKLTTDPNAYPPVDNGWLDVLVVADDGHVYHKYYSGTAWSGWEDLGQPSAGAGVQAHGDIAKETSTA